MLSCSRSRSDQGRCLSTLVLVNCLLGVALAVYSLMVELRLEADPTHVAMCDISEHMSCSKAFMSRFGKGFGLVAPVYGEESILNQPNSLYGIVFYSIIGVLGFMQDKRAIKLQFYLSILSNVGSVYLGFILYFVLYDFCVVCVTTYVINFFNLVLSYKRLQMSQQAVREPKDLKVD